MYAVADYAFGVTRTNIEYQPPSINLREGRGSEYLIAKTLLIKYIQYSISVMHQQKN